ncbi:MAG: pirin family protein, partial [Acidimicrobiia bacterium]|nr:pirin family protein [Acidimicrobiia bacterium]
MNEPILDLVELGMPWSGLDPFIMTVHHRDRYPAGNDVMGPAVSLHGRQIGSDFSYRDGWSMYHGDIVPGFPQHPHRGFETVTVVRQGYVDHSDSLGATGRY